MTDQGESTAGEASSDAPTRSVPAEQLSVEYDPTSPDSLCQTLVTAVANVTGREPEQLAPIYPVVNLELVARLVDTTDATLELAFEYEDCAITVDGDGEILVRPATR